MSQELATILKRTRGRTTEARERLASELLDRAKVLAAIGAAAAKGEASVEFSGPAGVPLDKTDTAAKLVAELVAGGFTTDWQERAPARIGDQKSSVLVVAW